MLNKKLSLALLPLIAISSLKVVGEEDKKSELDSMYTNGIQASFGYWYGFGNGNFGIGVQADPNFGFNGEYYKNTEKLFQQSSKNVTIAQNNGVQGEIDAQSQSGNKDEKKGNNDKKLIFTLPISLKAIFKPVENLYASVGVGVVFNFSDAISNKEISLDKDGKINITSNSKKMVAVRVTLGAEYYFTKNLGIYANVAFNFPMSNSVKLGGSKQDDKEKNEDKQEKISIDFAKMGIFSFSVGATFKLSIGNNNMIVGGGYSGAMLKYHKNPSEFQKKLVEEVAKKNQRIVEKLTEHFGIAAATTAAPQGGGAGQSSSSDR